MDSWLVVEITPRRAGQSQDVVLLFMSQDVVALPAFTSQDVVALPALFWPRSHDVVCFPPQASVWAPPRLRAAVAATAMVVAVRRRKLILGMIFLAVRGDDDDSCRRRPHSMAVNSPADVARAKESSSCGPFCTGFATKEIPTQSHILPCVVELEPIVQALASLFRVSLSSKRSSRRRCHPSQMTWTHTVMVVLSFQAFCQDHPFG